MPGTYDLYTDGYGSTPRNYHGVVRTGIVIGPSTSTLNIDLPVGTVAGTVTMGGVAVAGTSTDYGDIVLGRGSTFDPDLASIASTDKGSYSAPVLPGTYDVYYQVGSAVLNRFTTISPRNTHAKIASQVTVAATGTTTLNVDVPVATVKGNLTMNGVAKKNAGGGGLFLEGPNGDEAEIALTTVTSYSAPVVPGTYDLYYRAVNPGTTGAGPAPRNGYAKLRSGIVVAPGGTTQLDIDLPSVTVTGALTVAGAAVSNPQEEGVLWLQTDAGDYIDLGTTSALSYTVTLLPGQYDVYYKVDSGGTVVPTNTNAKIRCFDVGR